MMGLTGREGIIFDQFDQIWLVKYCTGMIISRPGQYQYKTHDCHVSPIPVIDTKLSWESLYDSQILEQEEHKVE